MLEVCCGSFFDAMEAWKGGAKRIELNSALFLGGLTPSASSLELVKENTGLKVIAMVRPRGAGFCYGDEDFAQMERECQELTGCGADGIAFGCLKQDTSLDMEKNRRMVDIIHSMGKEAVFHRAFDCVKDPFQTIEELIALGIDRVLTSGLAPTAAEGSEIIKELQKRYGAQMEILAGSGINASNARALMEKTGVTQVHSSCKAWKEDATTVSGNVSYSYAGPAHEMCYDTVSRETVKEILAAIGQ